MIGLGIIGLVILFRQNRVRAVALGGFCLAGFSGDTWPGLFPALDFLQPGRHSYTCFTGLALAGSAGSMEFFAGLGGMKEQSGSITGCLWLHF